MSTPILTFFSAKSGVGKTSLVYHLAWMFSLLEKRVVAVDLDPQSNLTAAFLDESSIETLWNAPSSDATIYQCVKTLIDTGNISSPMLQAISHNLSLLSGDIALASCDDTLSAEWLGDQGKGSAHRMRTHLAFRQVIQMAAKNAEADIVLVDTGSTLGAINHSALHAADFVAFPLEANLFSFQGLKNMGPTLRAWRNGWEKRKASTDFPLPAGELRPIGYLCQQYDVRLSRPIKAHDKWAQRIPAVYREAVLGEASQSGLTPDTDPYCLATLKHYRSLVPMGQEHRKPIFSLTPADGAIGAHANAVQDARKDFQQLAVKIADKMGITL